MIRTTGLKAAYRPIETVSETDNIHIVRWDCIPMIFNSPDGESSESNLAIWAEEIFYHKPTESELKKIIDRYYNDITDRKILSGFVWNDIPVWLSAENQFNYKAAYDLAMQTDGATLPVTFKFGLGNNHIYHVFATLAELTDFYIKSVAFVQDTLKEGWTKKDAFDWGMYEQMLSQ